MMMIIIIFIFGNLDALTRIHITPIVIHVQWPWPPSQTKWKRDLRFGLIEMDSIRNDPNRLDDFISINDALCNNSSASGGSGKKNRQQQQ